MHISNKLKVQVKTQVKIRNNPPVIGYMAFYPWVQIPPSLPTQSVKQKGFEMPILLKSSVT